MAFKAILFDMDGVLVDSLGTHFYAFNAVIEKFGKKRVSLKTFHEKFWGTYIEHDLRKVFGDIVPSKMKEIVDEYALQVGEFAKYTKIYSETKKVLTKLRERDLKIGLVTNTQKKTVDILIKEVGLESYFDVIIYGDS